MLGAAKLEEALPGQAMDRWTAFGTANEDSVASCDVAAAGRLRGLSRHPLHMLDQLSDGELLERVGPLRSDDHDLGFGAAEV